jgi:hypothetical protein
MHPELNIMVLRRDREREIRSLQKDYELRKALAVGPATPTSPPRWIAAGISALKRLGDDRRLPAAWDRRAEASV